MHRNNCKVFLGTYIKEYSLKYLKLLGIIVRYCKFLGLHTGNWTNKGIDKNLMVQLWFNNCDTGNIEIWWLLLSSNSLLKSIIVCVYLFVC